MNQNTFQLIRDATPFLSTKHAIKYQQYLQSPLATAVEIILAIQNSDAELALHEIAVIAGVHISTATETVRALRSGGYPFVVRQAGTQGHKILISSKHR